MNHKIATFICNKIGKSLSIDEELIDVYIYGFELILSFIISTSIILLLGIIIGQVISSIAFLFVFIFVRRFTGGFHANTYFKCQLFTVSFYLVAQLLSICTLLNVYYFILLSIVGTTIILLIGPIESPYKPLSKSSRIRNKIIGCFTFVAINIIGISIYKYKNIGNMFFYTNLIIIILMVMPYFYKKYSNAKNKSI